MYVNLQLYLRKFLILNKLFFLFFSFLANHDHDEARGIQRRHHISSRANYLSDFDLPFSKRK